jgi:hypothetical protein
VIKTTADNNQESFLVMISVSTYYGTAFLGTINKIDDYQPALEVSR